MNTTPTVFVQRVNSLSRGARSSSVSPSRVRQQSFHETRAAQAIMMPALSPFMREGTITKWLKKEGETFAAGDALLEVESDSFASLEVRAEMPGVLGKILIPDGTSNVPVEQVLAVVARRDANDGTRLSTSRPLRSLPRLDIPSTPFRTRYPEIPTPISAASFYPASSPRLPNTPVNTSFFQPSLHYYHARPTSSGLEPLSSHASATHRSPSSHSDSPTSLNASMPVQNTIGGMSVRRMLMNHYQTSCPGTCGSESTVGCGASNPRGTEVAGMNLKRTILANLNSNGSSVEREGSSEYFDGLL